VKKAAQMVDWWVARKAARWAGQRVVKWVGWMVDWMVDRQVVWMADLRVGAMADQTDEKWVDSTADVMAGWWVMDHTVCALDCPSLRNTHYPTNPHALDKVR
jgi:hypothetical protein